MDWVILVAVGGHVVGAAVFFAREVRYLRLPPPHPMLGTGRPGGLLRMSLLFFTAAEAAVWELAVIVRGARRGIDAVSQRISRDE
ncbi:hypothetical protein BJY24_004122 [Nocardia transvalensis]|uniref:Uncharacterized protein n=1 Tax=Nocardia transvalensis TaxID=37333 RepID=A0A7W9UK18_9NOCA|nr:hypothetical protein [Nocardia transvalensis]MBB5915255.1 hypothetical protein [Nocardia transvalensis]